MVIDRERAQPATDFVTQRSHSAGTAVHLVCFGLGAVSQRAASQRRGARWRAAGRCWGDRSRRGGRQDRVPIVAAWMPAGLYAEKFVAVSGGLRSLTPMAPHNRPPFDHHLERPEANATLDAASVEAVARRVVELMRGEGSSSIRGLVDAATLAAELGVTRSWVYEHRAELGAVRLGTGSKPRLRFDVQRAREVLTRSSRQPSADFSAPTRAESPPAHRRGGPRSAEGPRRPGRILAVRPRGAMRPPGAGS